MNNNRTLIPPGQREHRRQQKIARRQHIKQTLRQLHKSDNLFLDDSITHTKDEHTAIAKGNTNNAMCVAINPAHAQCNQPTNHWACPTWPQYSLPFGFCIQLDYKKAQPEQTCQFCQAE
jgi:hypothetical protein